MATIFDLHEEMEALLHLCETEDVDDESISKALASVTSKVEHKINAIVEMISEAEASHDLRIKEAERMVARAKSARRAAKRLKDYLQFWFENTNTTKISTERFTVSLCSNGGKRPLLVTGQPTSEYTTEVSKTEVNQDKIREALDKGMVLTFASYGEQGKHVRIK